MGRDLVTAVNYYDDPGDGSPPMPVYVGSSQVTNERPTIAVQVRVKDVSGQQSDFTLDDHGFQYSTHASPDVDFCDDQAIRNRYYLECAQLLKEVTGAVRVIPFGHQVRRGPSDWHRISHNNTRARGPLHRAHVDQSYNGALLRLREQFPDAGEAAEAMKRRWQIINVWRPIYPVRASPLAVADSTTVSDADLVPAAILLTDPSNPNRVVRRQESWTVKPNPAHRWYFKRNQTPDEVLLLKCFDSDEGVRARRAVHSAVEDLEADPDPQVEEGFAEGAAGHGVGRDARGNGNARRNRESVEVRCLVFY